MLSRKELITTALPFDVAESVLGNAQEPVQVSVSALNLTLPFLPEPHAELVKLIDFHTLPVNQAELESNLAQVIQMSYVLEGRGSHYVWAPPQSGKTIIALMLCALTYSRGGISLYMTDRLTTVRQTFDRARQFLDIQKEDIVFLSSLSPKDRGLVYKREGPLVVIGTAERVANDMKEGLIPLDRVGAEIHDEAHHFSEGDVKGSIKKGYESDRMNACIKVRFLLKNVKGLTTLFLSATPAATIEKWKRVRERTGNFEFYALNQQEQHLPEIVRERVEPASDMAQAAENLFSILEKIVERNPWIVECLEKIQRAGRDGKRSGTRRRKQKAIPFEDSEGEGDQTEVVETRTPIIGARMCEKLIAHVRDCDDWKKRISAAYEYRHIQQLAGNLTTYGRYLFLEAVAASLLRFQAEGKPLYLSRLHNDLDYCSAVFNAAKGTPYQAMFDVSRDALRINVKADVSEETRKEWRQALLDDGVNDHPYMARMITVLNDMLDDNPGEKCIIAADRVEQALFIRDFLNSLPDAKGIRAACITGKQTGRQRNEAIEEFEKGYAEGGVNALVVTSAAYSGIDLETVNRGYIYGCPDEPVELQQLLGRFGRTRDARTSGVKSARVHCPLNSQSPDELFLNLGLGQMSNMRRKLLEMSTVVNDRV